MKTHTKSALKTFGIFLLLSFIVGCSSSSDDDDSSAAIIVPSINPAFDSITSVTMSDSPSGTYTPVVYTYDAGTEKITLAENAIGSGGNYVKITGEATVDGSAGTYTVMTYVKNNKSAIAAHEITTLAVAMVENGDATDFDTKLQEIAEEAGFSKAADISNAMTAAERADVPNLQEALLELANDFNFETSDIDLTSMANIQIANMYQIAWGASLYNNWIEASGEMPVPTKTEVDHSSHAHGKVTNRDNGADHDRHPATLTLELTDGSTQTRLRQQSATGDEHGGFVRFARCKECHGFDQMGDEGSFAMRERSTLNLFDPNGSDSASFIQRPEASAGTNLLTRTTPVAGTDFAPQEGAGNGRMYANVTTALTGANVADLAASWTAAIDATDTDSIHFSDKHPDFSRTAAADATNSTNPYQGVNNDTVPSLKQVEAITAFLNYADGKPDQVMTFANGQYILNDTSSSKISQGEEFYADYCFRCHGAPNNSGFNPFGLGNNFVSYLSNDDETLDQVHFASVFHVARWGETGSVMTRDRIGYPAAHDVAGIMAYLSAYQAGDTNLLATNAIGNNGVADVAAGEAFYYANCDGCHSASATALSVSDAADIDDAGEDLSFRCFGDGLSGTAAVGDDETCGENQPVPNLRFSHFAMTADLSDISTIMDNTNGEKNLTQQEINNLAGFFSSLTATQ